MMKPFSFSHSEKKKNWKKNDRTAQLWATPSNASETREAKVTGGGLGKNERKRALCFPLRAGLCFTWRRHHGRRQRRKIRRTQSDGFGTLVRSQHQYKPKSLFLCFPVSPSIILNGQVTSSQTLHSDPCPLWLQERTPHCWARFSNSDSVPDPRGVL